MVCYTSTGEDWRTCSFLNCGTQRESTAGKDVKIAWKSGAPYVFPSEAKGVPATQPTIFFDANFNYDH